MRIGIVGGGWYGVHIALALTKLGHDVTIFEKNHDIFEQISGNFGVRLHAGPHYPRSPKTRESCRRSFDRFIATYPELVIEHEYSTYALGKLDSDGQPSKVTYQLFKSVCTELESAHEIEPHSAGYHDLISAWQMYEPSIAVGKLLRDVFKRLLSEHSVRVLCNFTVKGLDQTGESISIINDHGITFDRFDYVINATSYQSFVYLKERMPFDINVVYQPCLALVYEDMRATSRPFSFIVMDGWFPCIMPYCNEQSTEERIGRKYIVTHGKWTIMGSFQSSREAENLLARIDDEFIESNVKPFVSAEMIRFWPEFESRFRYTGWKGSVLAKLKTEKEFRSAVTFEKDRLIHIIPGKVSNIFDAEQEVVALINQQNILSKAGFKYVNGGVLDDALHEITERPHEQARSTCNIQTYQEIHPEKKDEDKKTVHSFSFWSSSHNTRRNGPADKQGPSSICCIS